MGEWTKAEGAGDGEQGGEMEKDGPRKGKKKNQRRDADGADGKKGKKLANCQINSQSFITF